MRQAPKGVDENAGAAPRRRAWRDVENQLVLDLAEPTIDVRLVGELFFAQSDSHPRQRSLQRIELAREVHGGRVRAREQPRNLVVWERGLVR